MPQPSGEGGDFAIARTSVEVVVRVGLLLLLAFWCFSIAQPFLVPIVWGMVIAVAVYRGFAKLRHLLGERDGLAATLVSIILLLVLIVPLGHALARPGRRRGRDRRRLDRGEVTIPPPPGWLAGWPVIGAPLDQFWQPGHRQSRRGPGPASSRSCGRSGVWLLSFVAGAGFGMLSFMAAIVIAGRAARAQRCGRAAGRDRGGHG